MLAVLLKILSIIGIVLLWLLVLFLVVLLLVLFWPVTYRIDALRDSSRIDVSLKARWLLGLIRISYHYPDPGRLKAKLLFFTIHDSGREKKPKEAKSRKRAGTENAAEDRHESSKTGRDGDSDWKYESLAEPDRQKNAETKPSAGEHEAPVEPGPEGQKKKEDSVETVSGEENNGPFSGIFDVFNSKTAKIKYTFLKLCDKIKHILENLSYYRDMLAEEETKLLFGQVWTRLYKILKSLHPRRLTAHVRFGTGSPDTTGYILGLYCMLSPFLGQNINIVPDFEDAVLTGELHALGRIKAFVLLHHGSRMLLDKNLRLFIRKMKREDG